MYTFIDKMMQTNGNTYIYVCVGYDRVLIVPSPFLKKSIYCISLCVTRMNVSSCVFRCESSVFVHFSRYSIN